MIMTDKEQSKDVGEVKDVLQQLSTEIKSELCRHVATMEMVYRIGFDSGLKASESRDKKTEKTAN